MKLFCPYRGEEEVVFGRILFLVPPIEQISNVLFFRDELPQQGGMDFGAAAPETSIDLGLTSFEVTQFVQADRGLFQKVRTDENLGWGWLARIVDFDLKENHSDHRG